MDTSNVQLIVTKIEELIKAAGGKIEGFYPYVVKQAIIAGWVNLIGLCFSLVCWVVFFIRMTSSKPKVDGNNDCPNREGVLCIVWGVLGLFSSLASTFNSINLLALFNPNFYAVKILLNMVRGG